MMSTFQGGLAALGLTLSEASSLRQNDRRKQGLAWANEWLRLWRAEGIGAHARIDGENALARLRPAPDSPAGGGGDISSPSGGGDGHRDHPRDPENSRRVGFGAAPGAK